MLSYPVFTAGSLEDLDTTYSAFSTSMYDNSSARSTSSNISSAYATIQSDIFKPTKYGGKYTVTLIPGTKPAMISDELF